jgi:signal transduction histidine kinase
MRQGARGFCRVSRGWCAFALALLFSLQAFAATAVRVESAQMQLTPDGTFGPIGDAAPALGDNWQAVPLPHYLPRSLVSGERDRIDTAWYRIEIPQQAAEVDKHKLRLYLPRWQTIGQVAVYADNRLVYRSAAGPIWNGFNHPLWLLLDAPQDGERPRSVLVRLDHSANAGLGLSSAWFGDADGLAVRHAWREWLQADLPYIASATFLTIGLFALGVWVLRREAVYGLFALVAGLFFIRCLHYHLGLQPLPISEAWFGWMTVNSLSWLIAVVYIFGFRLHNDRHPWLERSLLALVILSTVVSMPSLAWLPSVSLLAPLAYLLMLVAVVVMSIAGLWYAWRSRSRDAMLVAFWNAMSFPTAAHDWMVQNYKLDIERLYVLPYTSIGLFGLFLYVVLRRYVGALRESEQAQNVLEQRLHAREIELSESHAKLREIERERVLSQERQRLMQDMHDGLGSSLMGALKAVEHGYEQDLAKVLRECIEDLKLAIDSLEPVQADLLLLLATLRFRLGTRLEQAGVKLEWRVEDVPPITWLDPQGGLHILRILQEVLSNIVKHSGADRVAVTTEQRGDSVVVAVEDSGKGFDPAAVATPGRGLVNVQRRAAEIGATARWISQPGHTRFELVLPMEKPAAVARLSPLAA